MSDWSLITFDSRVQTFCYTCVVTLIMNNSKFPCTTEQLSFGRKHEIEEDGLSNQDVSNLFERPFTLEELLEINVVEYYKAFLTEFPLKKLEYSNRHGEKTYCLFKMLNTMKAVPQMVTKEMGEEIYKAKSYLVRGLLCELCPHACPCEIH